MNNYNIKNPEFRPRTNEPVTGYYKRIYENIKALKDLNAKNIKLTPNELQDLRDLTTIVGQIQAIYGIPLGEVITKTQVELDQCRPERKSASPRPYEHQFKRGRLWL